MRLFNIKKMHLMSFYNYIPRTFGFFMTFWMVWSVTYAEGLPLYLWLIVGYITLVHSHVVFVISANLKHPRNFELNMLHLDALLNGCILPIVFFNPWVSVCLYLAMTIGALSVHGIIFCLKNLVAITLGAVLVGSIYGFHFVYESSVWTIAICAFAILVFMNILGYQFYHRAIYLRKIKNQLADVNHDVTQLNEVVTAATSSLDLGTVMNSVNKTLVKVFPFDSVAILLPDKQQRCLYFHSIYGDYITENYLRDIKAIQIEISKKDSISSLCFTHKRIIYLPKITHDMDMLVKDREIYDVKPFLALLMYPVVVQDHAIGLICFYSHYHSFDLEQREIDKIKGYVKQISIVINNSLLYEESVETQKALNTQKEHMEDISQQLSKYLSPQIYDYIFKGKQHAEIGVKRKRLTIFFSDITGFTDLTDRIESEVLVEMLNMYLAEMSEIAIKHGGTIDKYIGDAIMIFFGDPESKGVKKDALACVNMSLEMYEKLKTLRKAWSEEGIPESLNIRVGINTGYCTVGNYGCEYHMDYTIIGGQVNLASRLEGYAEPGQVIISHDTYLLVRDHFICEKGEEITVKGIARPVQTYEVKGVKVEGNNDEGAK